MHAQAGSFSKPTICPLKMVKPVKTCWWSWNKTVGHIYQLQKAIKLYTADINAGIDPLQLGDWSVMTSLLDVMGPISDVGFALEQNPVTSPYVLRQIVKLLAALHDPWHKAPMYSGRLVKEAENDIDG